MKKKFELIKIIQLALYIVLSVAGLIAICTDSALYQMVGRDPSVRALCILLWLCLGLSFAGILWDLSTHASFKKEYRELDQAVYNDQVVGIANRFSCDAVIEKYMDKPLPDNLGCIMLDIANIREINEKYGHARGNETLRAFSDILSTAAPGLCFVGRNGGSKFLAIFEDCNEEKINTFLSHVNKLVDEGNIREDIPRIAYRTGRAFSREDSGISITRLIGLADQRLENRTDPTTGAANRFACDDLISRYLERPLPEGMCCVMTELCNIRKINDHGGHTAGNLAIRRFSDALRESAHGMGFVGRNGGMKFMVLFENCTDEILESFMHKLRSAVDALNAADEGPAIEYTCSSAFNAREHSKDIVQLVALADRRLNEMTDRVSGISNRAGCDELIERYVGKPLPDNIGCVMLDISNIREINDIGGYSAGNNAIHRFGEVLQSAASGLCFVGRNGGTKFLALFEDCSDEKLADFLSRVRAGIDEYNNIADTETIRYRYGTAFHEGVAITEINRLIALSDRRSRGEA